MSDNEVVNEFNNGKIVDNDASDDDSSISARDAKMKVLVEKSSKIVKNGDDSDSDVENDHSSSTNNGFGVDGEPDYKPRKASTSSSESDADDDLDEVSASSESKSKSVDAGAARAASPPQPKSRSSSINQSVEEKKSSSSDTEDEEELPKDGAAAPVPVPVARKVSLPHHDEDDEVEKRASPVKKVDSEDEGEELTRDEWELSKRETVHLDEDLVASKASHSEVVDDEISEADEDERQKSDSSEDEEEEKKDEEKEIDEKEEEPVRTNGGSQHKEDSSSSSSDEEEVVEEKPSSPKRSLTIQSPPSREENPQEGERTPSPNVPKPNPDGSVTKAYIAALNNNNNNSPGEHDPVSKAERPTKAVKDITQMYVAKTNQTPPASPKPIARTKPAKDITQLYTGKFEQGNNASPGSVDKLSPKKHNMSTAIDKNEIRKAYDDVRSDTSTTEWAVFKFDGNSLGVTATGNDFSEFKALFGNEDRGFGYIRIKTGDEMSKRCKFVFVTWVGPSVSVMKKAKMSTDKALMKDIIQNLSVELQLENHAEFSHDYFKMQVDKAAGARYGTGVRDL